MPKTPHSSRNLSAITCNPLACAHPSTSLGMTLSNAEARAPTFDSLRVGLSNVEGRNLVYPFEAASNGRGPNLFQLPARLVHDGAPVDRDADAVAANAPDNRGRHPGRRGPGHDLGRMSLGHRNNHTGRR